LAVRRFVIELVSSASSLLVTGCGGLHHSPTDRACDERCLELDHIFIFVSKDAPERETLTRLGLRTDGHVARHTGQGTASIGFIFENAYLELLWVENQDEFQASCSAAGGDFCDRARWRETGASPFGIGLRNRCADPHPPPLKHREYRAEWMNPDSCIHIVDDTDNREPEFFVVPPYLALPSWLRKVDATHPRGVSRLTRAELTIGPKRRGLSDFGVGSGFNFVSADSHKPMSHAIHVIRRCANVRFTRGRAPLLTLTFDDARQGQSADLRPDLPLFIQY
jgi:hypothetical protein